MTEHISTQNRSRSTENKRRPYVSRAALLAAGSILLASACDPGDTDASGGNESSPRSTPTASIALDCEPGKHDAFNGRTTYEMQTGNPDDNAKIVVNKAGKLAATVLLKHDPADVYTIVVDVTNKSGADEHETTFTVAEMRDHSNAQPVTYRADGISIFAFPPQTSPHHHQVIPFVVDCNPGAVVPHPAPQVSSH